LSNSGSVYYFTHFFKNNNGSDNYDPAKLEKMSRVTEIRLVHTMNMSTVKILTNMPETKPLMLLVLRISGSHGRV